jgi:hypothetical protein
VSNCHYCGAPTTFPTARELILAYSPGVFEQIVVCPRPECLERLADAPALWEARELEIETGGPVCIVWIPPTAR